MKKRAIGILGPILLLFAIWPANAQERSVVWERWDVVIDNVDTAANRFDVTEIYDILFSGTFRFGSAVIALENLERIDNVQVYEGGQPLQSDCSGAERPGTYCARNAAEGKSIIYYFRAPITNQPQSFRIEYTVTGAIRVYEGGDELGWTAIPDDHYGFPILSSTITVELPPGFAPREGIDPIITDGAPGEIQVNGTTVKAIATRIIGGDESFKIGLQYPHDPNARMPVWQAAFDEQQAYEQNVAPLVNLGALLIALVLLVGGPLGVYYVWYTRGRDPEIGPVPEYLTEPPSDLPPAVVGTLVDERADLRDVLSTLIDLAHRGYVVIEEEREDTGLFGLGGKKSSFVFKRTDKDTATLRTFERDVLDKVFGRSMERSLDALKNKFYKYIPALQANLYDELVAEEFFGRKPDDTRRIWSGLGGALLVIPIVLGVVIASTSEDVNPILFLIPVALGITGVLVSIVGQHMPAKTRKGALEAAKWQAFYRYLRNLDRYDSAESVAERFDEFLPYAVAFGMERSWVRRFSQVETVPIPYWYYPRYFGGRYSRGYTAGSPLSGGGLPSHGDLLPGELASAGSGSALESMSDGLAGGLESISNGLTDMLSSASSALTSRPQSSGSGRWSSGGSSWSGGGFSGGGFSGGGSRGFG